MAAHLSGLAETARGHIDAALAIDPKNPFALAVSGAWHLEIVAHAGSMLADLFYGASREAGERDFQSARALEPANLLFDVQYALAVLTLDAEGYQDRAFRLVSVALDKTAGDAIERYMANVAKRLHDTLDAGDMDRTRRLVARVQGLPEPEPDTGMPEDTR